MKLRKNFLPRTVTDIGAFIFVAFMIPSTYFFVWKVTLPSLYEVGSQWYTIHFITSTFLLINVLASLVAVMIVDTSTKWVFIPSTLQRNWRFCAVCEAVAPPRSWHCNVCNTCILKRDHHCIFSGCCIGHHNHRFFLTFLIYMCIGTIYATRFNSVFIWQLMDFSSPTFALKIMFPFAVLVFGIDASQAQCYIMISLINAVGMLFCVSLAFYHIRCLFKGCVTYEMNRKITDYDKGVRQNIASVFGKWWCISWASPFIPSELPHDGINWEPNTNESNKNR